MIHYFGYYFNHDEESEYSGNVPGRLKMDYIINCIDRAKPNEKLNIISLCQGKKLFNPKKEITLTNKDLLIHPFSLSSKYKIFRGLNKVLFFIQLAFYILFKTHAKDTILIYHSIWLSSVMIFFKRFIHRNFIMELEEVYGYSAIGILPQLKKEIENITKFKKFIFVNDTISKYLNLNVESSVVCYGAYQLKKRSTDRFNDGKIHIVYAGTIENKKNGALTAINVAKFLGKEYVLHIAGFGTQSTINMVQTLIAAHNKTHLCKIVFHGYLKGEKLDNLLWSCHIGLSTYKMEKYFSNCSFPSKLTSYVNHELVVCVGNCETYRISKMNHNWILYDSFDPADIAKSIKNYNSGFYHDYYELINSLDEKVVKWFGANT